MKVRYLALLLTPLFSTSVLADVGYTGPGAESVMTVVAAQTAPDDNPVVLQGHIIQKLNNEKYEFKDATGTITVEIDDEDMPPIAFNEKTRVKLTGEVDKNFFDREIDVDLVEIVN